jgi:ribosomal protein S12 methylthiotransferase
MEQLFAALRARLPDVAIRTHFIVGFPGETDEDFEALLESVERSDFDHVGCFAYSREDGTPAARMKGQVPEGVKVDRRRRLMEAQRRASTRVWTRWVGRTADVLIDRPAAGVPGRWVGRLAQQGYEVDGVTHVRAEGAAAPRPGDLARVRITKARHYDLEGEVVA